MTHRKKSESPPFLRPPVPEGNSHTKKSSDTLLNPFFGSQIERRRGYGPTIGVAEDAVALLVTHVALRRIWL